MLLIENKRNPNSGAFTWLVLGSRAARSLQGKDTSALLQRQALLCFGHCHRCSTASVNSPEQRHHTLFTALSMFTCHSYHKPSHISEKHSCQQLSHYILPELQLIESIAYLLWRQNYTYPCLSKWCLKTFFCCSYTGTLVARKTTFAFRPAGMFWKWCSQIRIETKVFPDPLNEEHDG